MSLLLLLLPTSSRFRVRGDIRIFGPARRAKSKFPRVGVAPQLKTKAEVKPPIIAAIPAKKAKVTPEVVKKVEPNLKFFNDILKADPAVGRSPEYIAFVNKTLGYLDELWLRLQELEAQRSLDEQELEALNELDRLYLLAIRLEEDLQSLEELALLVFMMSK